MNPLSCFRLFAAAGVLLSAQIGSIAEEKASAEVVKKGESKVLKGMRFAVENTSSWGNPQFIVMVSGASSADFTELELSAYTADGRKVEVRPTGTKGSDFACYRPSIDPIFEKLATVKIQIAGESAMFEAKQP